MVPCAGHVSGLGDAGAEPPPASGARPAPRAAARRGGADAAGPHHAPPHDAGPPRARSLTGPRTVRGIRPAAPVRPPAAPHGRRPFLPIRATVFLIVPENDTRSSLVGTPAAPSLDRTLPPRPLTARCCPEPPTPRRTTLRRASTRVCPPTCGGRRARPAAPSMTTRRPAITLPRRAGWTAHRPVRASPLGQRARLRHGEARHA